MGAKMKINRFVRAKCERCGIVQEVVWGKYGAEFACFSCDAAPVELIKVGA